MVPHTIGKQRSTLDVKARGNKESCNKNRREKRQETNFGQHSFHQFICSPFSPGPSFFSGWLVALFFSPQRNCSSLYLLVPFCLECTTVFLVARTVFLRMQTVNSFPFAIYFLLLLILYFFCRFLDSMQHK